MLLVLYVERGYPPEKRNIGEVYQLLAMSSEKELNAIFAVLDISHPAKAPCSIFRVDSWDHRLPARTYGRRFAGSYSCKRPWSFWSRWPRTRLSCH